MLGGVDSEWHDMKLMTQTDKGQVIQSHADHVLDFWTSFQERREDNGGF